MKLTLLGTGTPTPSTIRSGSSYLLEAGDSLILFDCGPGSYFRYLQTGRPLTDLTHVAISHFHYDHCSDFATIALARWDQAAGCYPELKVIGPRHVHQFVETLLGADGAFGPDQVARTEHEASIAYFRARGGEGARAKIAPQVTEMKAGDVFDDGDLSLSCVEVPHVQPHLGCLAFRLDHAGQSFCYSGDASYSKAFIKLASDCDVMVHMCHRITGTNLTEAAERTSASHMDVARIAHEASVKTCVFSHISEQMDVPGVPERLLQEIGGTYTGHAIWANDLMQVDFGSPQPKELI